MIPDVPEPFCHVFIIPESFPEGFCFGGGKPVTFQMVDWFNAWPPDPASVSGKVLMDITVEDWRAMMTREILRKRYAEAARPGTEFLVLTNFGAALIIKKPHHDASHQEANRGAEVPRTPSRHPGG